MARAHEDGEHISDANGKTLRERRLFHSPFYSLDDAVIF